MTHKCDSAGCSDERMFDIESERRKCAERIAELEAKLERQASSHGMYVTQTLEPKIDELQEQIRDQAKGHQADARCWQIERAELEKELQESARLHGMGSEREARQLARIAELEKELKGQCLGMGDDFGDSPSAVIQYLKQENARLRKALENIQELAENSAESWLIRDEAESSLARQDVTQNEGSDTKAEHNLVSQSAQVCPACATHCGWTHSDEQGLDCKLLMESDPDVLAGLETRCKTCGEVTHEGNCVACWHREGGP